MGIQANDALIGHRLVLLILSFLKAPAHFALRKGTSRYSRSEGPVFLPLAGLDKIHN